MPEFYPEHVPDNVSEFVAGYLGAAEWLLPEKSDWEDSECGIERDKIRGWSRASVREAKRDCRDFVRANRADLETYCEESGRDMESAGHDFYLSRNGHGAGFFDRGNHPVFNRLQDAARVYSSWCECPWLNRGWINAS